MIGQNAIRSAGRRRFSGAAYVAEAVVFDGSNDYTERGATLTGISDNTDGTISLWVLKPDTNDNVNNYFFDLSDTGGVGLRGYIVRDGHATAGGTAALLLKDTSGTQITLYAVGGGTFDMIDGNWHHVLMSWDASETLIYVDDTEANSSPATPTGVNIDYTKDKCAIGSIWNGDSKLNGELSEFYFTDEYIDISVESNRRKFISAGGAPVDLGSDGSTPTSTQAIVYFKGAASVWNAGTNAGSGGNFTMTGSVADSSNEPVELP